MSKIIEINNITKSYKINHTKERIVAVDDVSFSVNESTLFAFLGKNGAGKTSLIKILITLSEADQGDLRIGGYSLKKNRNRIKNRIGYLPQISSLDKYISAWHNIYFYSRYYGLKDKEITKQINQFSDLFEMEIDKKKPYTLLSGGQRRLVELICCLMHNPDLLILDEPTTGLDVVTRNKMWQYLQKLVTSNNKTVFFSTHYLEEADRYSDRIGIINNGKYILEGTPNEIKNNYLKEHVNIQLKPDVDTKVILAIDTYLNKIRGIIKYEMKDNQYSIYIKENLPAYMNKFMTDFSRSKIPVLSIGIGENSLDDAFMYLTDSMDHKTGS